MIVQHSAQAPNWFKKALKEISSDLRVIWGRESVGIERWIIQRQIPPQIHGKLIRDWERDNPGKERIFTQQLTDDNGNITDTRAFDFCPEWAMVHVVENKDYELEDERGYREPDRRDIESIQHWMFDFEGPEQQIRAMREERERAKLKFQQERVGHIAREIVNSAEIWETKFIDSPAKVMKGTEL